jgi:hypothetical protein
MNKKITSALIGLLLIGIVTAGLVPYLSNIVTGSVKVEGPVFYLDNTNILTGKTGSGYLRLNDDSVSGEEFILTSNRFYSDSLGIDNFYPLDFEITLNAQVFNLPRNITTNEITETCSINVIVYQVSSSGSFKRNLCRVVKENFDNEGNFEEYQFICPGISESEISFDEYDRIELSLDEQCPSGSTAHIELKGNSYIQTVAK